MSLGRWIRNVRLALLVVALLTCVSSTHSQTQSSNPPKHAPDFTLDFENTLTGWSKTGVAFDSQPTDAATINTDRVEPVRLGGDYWRKLSYPLGQHGNYLILSSNSGTGTLTSDHFVLDHEQRFFSFLIGGTSDLSSERVELQILSTSQSDAAELQRLIREWSTQTQHGNSATAAIVDGEYVVAIAETAEQGAEGRSLEVLQQIVREVPKFLCGRTARIRIIDNSDSGHINADHFQFTNAHPESAKLPVWGYGDYHTHPMSHLAFGAAHGIHLLWGSPGTTDYRKYKDEPELFTEDIPHCTPGHGGGKTAEVFINNAEQRVRLAGTLSTLWDWLTCKLTDHPRSGGPEFHDFPTFLSGTHQQIHITQIRRNYDGGLRLMVALATHNRGAEYVASKVRDDGSIETPTDDPSVIKAVICGMQELANANQDWMEIAYSPEDARRIIRHDKLAVILGVEVDQTGNLDLTGNMRKEVEELWDLGVRVITPIHGVDNRLGGPAAWNEIYSWLNDFIHREKFDLSVKDLDTVNPTFFTLREAGCNSPKSDPREECVPFRFEEKQHRVVIKNQFPLGVVPYPEERLEPSYQNFSGEKNALGLTRDGHSYIQELMRIGMIIDTAHMSDRSVENVYEEIGLRLQRYHPECAGFSLYTTVSKPCLRFAYPAIVSHVHFRAEARKTGSDFLASEYDISDANVEAVRRVGGVIGPFVTQDPSWPQYVTPFRNDCAMSSKGFGFSFDYGFKQMRGQGIGMATDATFIPEVAPRFGPNACWGYHLAKNPLLELAFHIELYNQDAQENGVVYAGVPRNKKVKYGYNIPLEPYRMPFRKRPFDFNVDGLAHFGLVPDMLQDLKNLGMRSQNFDALFASAEAYLKMWEKTWDASGCGSDEECCAQRDRPPSKSKCDESYLMRPR